MKLISSSEISGYLSKYGKRDYTDSVSSNRHRTTEAGIMRNDEAEKDSTGRIKPGKTAPYVKKGMVNRLVLWYTDYIHIDEK